LTGWTQNNRVGEPRPASIIEARDSPRASHGEHSPKHHVPDTFLWYKDYLQDFCDLYGTLLVQNLKPLHVSRWLDAHPGWKGSRRCAVIAIKRAFN
jgi:hypothetical protein